MDKLNISSNRSYTSLPNVPREEKKYARGKSESRDDLNRSYGSDNIFEGQNLKNISYLTYQEIRKLNKTLSSKLSKYDDYITKNNQVNLVIIQKLNRFFDQIQPIDFSKVTELINNYDKSKEPIIYKKYNTNLPLNELKSHSYVNDNNDGSGDKKYSKKSKSSDVGHSKVELKHDLSRNFSNKSLEQINMGMNGIDSSVSQISKRSLEESADRNKLSSKNSHIFNKDNKENIHKNMSSRQSFTNLNLEHVNKESKSIVFSEDKDSMKYKVNINLSGGEHNSFDKSNNQKSFDKNNYNHSFEKHDKFDESFMNYFVNYNLFRTQNIIDTNNISLKNSIIEYLNEFKESLNNYLANEFTHKIIKQVNMCQEGIKYDFKSKQDDIIESFNSIYATINEANEQIQTKVESVESLLSDYNIDMNKNSSALESCINQIAADLNNSNVNFVTFKNNSDLTNDKLKSSIDSINNQLTIFSSSYIEQGNSITQLKNNFTNYIDHFEVILSQCLQNNIITKMETLKEDNIEMKNQNEQIIAQITQKIPESIHKINENHFDSIEKINYVNSEIKDLFEKDGIKFDNIISIVDDYNVFIKKRMDLDGAKLDKLSTKIEELYKNVNTNVSDSYKLTTKALTESTNSLSSKITASNQSMISKLEESHRILTTNKYYNQILDKLSKLDTTVKSKNDIAGLDSIVNNCEYQIFKHHYYNYLSFSYDDQVFIGFGQVADKEVNMLFRANGKGMTAVNTVGNKPCPRSRVAYCVFNRSLYIYGGTGAEYYSDLWRLDLHVLKKWELLDSDNFTLGKRFGSRMVSFQDSIYFYGGFNNNTQDYPPGLYKMGLNNLFTPVGLSIPGRYQHIMAATKHHIYVGFGYREEKGGSKVLLNDVYQYNPLQNTILQILSNIELQRDYSLNCLVKGEDVLVFGGYNYTLVMRINGEDCSHFYDTEAYNRSSHGNIVVFNEEIYDLMNLNRKWVKRIDNLFSRLE